MRIVLVDGDAHQLQRLELALNGEAGIEIVGAFASGEAALEAMDAEQEVPAPEAMLLDIQLPGMSGIELIRQVRARGSDMDLVVHTFADDAAVVAAGIHAGASGYLLKGTPLTRVVEALQDLAGGGAPLTPRVARTLIRELWAEAPKLQGEALSAREREVLKEIELGHTYALIGQRLGISQHTVNAHVKNAYRKLQAADRTQALALARRRGMI